MALSRIAALLLDGGRISYSHFKISLSIHEDSVVGLKHNSYMFPVLQQTKVIIGMKFLCSTSMILMLLINVLDLLEVSNHLHLIVFELTYYLE